MLHEDRAELKARRDRVCTIRRPSEDRATDDDDDDEAADEELRARCRSLALAPRLVLAALLLWPLRSVAEEQDKTGIEFVRAKGRSRLPSVVDTLFGAAALAALIAVISSFASLTCLEPGTGAPWCLAAMVARVMGIVKSLERNRDQPVAACAMATGNKGKRSEASYPLFGLDKGTRDGGRQLQFPLC